MTGLRLTYREEYPILLTVENTTTQARDNTMTTTTIDSLIAAFALAMIVVPIIILGIQDARRHPWS